MCDLYTIKLDGSYVTACLAGQDLEARLGVQKVAVTRLARRARELLKCLTPA